MKAFQKRDSRRGDGILPFRLSNGAARMTYPPGADQALENPSLGLVDHPASQSRPAACMPRPLSGNTVAAWDISRPSPISA